MNFTSFISEEAKRVDQELIKYLEAQKNQLKKINPLLDPLFSLVINSNKNGKRLRAILVKLGYLLGGGKKGQAILDPMLAVEIFHSAILAHDDIIDQSPLRRGEPTLHYALGNDHHALSQTIVLADYGLFLSTKLINESDFDPGSKNKALQIFTNTILDTIIGEIIDVEIPYKKLPLQKKDALTISLFKTARYTFTAPLQIGATLAGVKEATLEKLQAFGDNLGIAFQIQDDILGVFGDIKEMGKSNLSDLTEGKVTLLAAHSFANCNIEQKQTLDKLYGKKDLTPKDADQIREIFKSVGSLDFAYKTALKYTHSAISVIDSLEVDAPTKSILRELADFLMKRNK